MPMPDFGRRTFLAGGLSIAVLTALNSVSTPAQAALGGVDVDSTVPEGKGAPKIFSTKEWGARNARSAITVENRKPTYIVVHHTVMPGNNEDYSQAHAFQISRDIQTFHMDTRGWIDSGQQFTISRGGFITEGRHRSLEVLSGGTKHVLGANVANHNSDVIGIENEGLYSTVDAPGKLWDSLVDLVSYIARQYKIPPENIKGHRDFNSTECPGQILYNRVPELRNAVGTRLGLRVDQPVEWPLLRPGDSGPKVSLAQHLLRAQGNQALSTDGLFGPSTQEAVAQFANSKGVQPHNCQASTHVREEGFLGADIWPLLTSGVSSTEPHITKLVGRAASRTELPASATESTRWRQLLTNLR